MSTRSTLEERPPRAEAADPTREIVRELPEPASLRRLIGPSVILVGVGVASGEYILFPYLLAGFDQPLVLVTISTALGGVIMVIYSCLLVVTNRRYLPTAVKLRGYRLGIIVFAILLLGPRRRSSGSTSSGTCSDAPLRSQGAGGPRRVGGNRRGRLRGRARLGSRGSDPGPSGAEPQPPGQA